MSVDSTAPVPSLACPRGGTDPLLALTWSATDASPVSGYDIEVATDAGAYTPWIGGVTDTSGTFAGQPGHSYAFRVRATDDLGNVSGFVSCGPVSIGFAPVSPPPVDSPPGAPRPLPAAAHLRLTRIRTAHGRLIVRGRLMRGATGSVTCTYVAHGRRRVSARAIVRSGSYRVSLPFRARKGLLTVRYSGDRAFAPQRITRRIR
jgi:hypothetical protein